MHAEPSLNKIEFLSQPNVHSISKIRAKPLLMKAPSKKRAFCHRMHLLCSLGYCQLPNGDKLSDIEWSAISL